MPTIHLTDYISLMNFTRMIFSELAEARDSCISILGSGGKTALLHTLGAELSAGFSRVLITSLTRAGVSAPHPVQFMDDLKSASLKELYTSFNPLYLMYRGDHPEKLTGLSEAELDSLRRESDVTLCECDGARNLPLKQHIDTDPVAPEYSSHVIVVVGADAVGHSLNDGFVHRPEIFAKRWGISFDHSLEPDFIAEVVTSPQGYLAKVPHSKVPIFYVNKSDHDLTNARLLAASIQQRNGFECFLGSLQAGTWERAS